MAYDWKIPSIDELSCLSLEKVQSIWRQNNEILIGIIENNQIPRFGLHGTDSMGREGIPLTKTPNSNWFYVASYDYQLDPITFLADLYTIATKASNYTERD